MIKNLQDLHLSIFGHNEVETDEERQQRIKRSVYKGTRCGAWIDFSDEGVVVGSIVEGVDYGTDSHVLNYPFDNDKFWGKLTEVEDEAEAIWNDTHGCDDCFPDWEHDDFIDTKPINLECKTCQG
jgi:hypothetical protein